MYIVIRSGTKFAQLWHEHDPNFKYLGKQIGNADHLPRLALPDRPMIVDNASSFVKQHENASRAGWPLFSMLSARQRQADARSSPSRPFITVVRSTKEVSLECDHRPVNEYSRPLLWCNMPV